MREWIASSLRLAMTSSFTEYNFAILATRCARVIQKLSPQKREGAGNAGCALHPRSRVQKCTKKAHTSIQVQRRQSDIPCAMVLRLIPCSPRRRIRLVTVAHGLAVRILSVGLYSNLRQLDTSNGCQDHTVLPYASALVRLRSRRSLTGKPALQLRFALDAAASTASCPNVRDDGQRPSKRDRIARACRDDLPDGESGIFFQPKLDRANRLEMIAENRPAARGIWLAILKLSKQDSLSLRVRDLTRGCWIDPIQPLGGRVEEHFPKVPCRQIRRDRHRIRSDRRRHCDRDHRRGSGRGHLLNTAFGKVSTALTPAS